MELLGKLISGSLMLATTATGGLVLHNHLKPETIGEELNQKEGLDLLREDYSQWQELIEKHKDSQNTTPKIKDLTLPQEVSESSNSNKSELQAKCKNLWDTKISTLNDEDYKRIKQEIKDWCATNPKALNKN